MNKISTERKKIGITQAELARQLNWNQSRVANYELGIRKPDIECCRKIVMALNNLGGQCTLDSVFPPKPNNYHNNGAAA